MKYGVPLNLFAVGQLSVLLAAASKEAVDKLAAWPPDDLLNTPEVDVSERLIELATVVRAPSLRRSEAWLEPPSEVKVDSIDFGRRLQVVVTRFTLVVPVTGDPRLLALSASKISGG